MARKGGNDTAASEAPSADTARSGSSKTTRIVGAVGLILLIAATALVFVTSRPLADVEIASATLHRAPCPEGLDCPSGDVVSISGTLAGVSRAAEESVYVLVKPALSSTWSVGAEVQPTESGDWEVEGVSLPPSADASVDVRAVVAQ
jgi:hypothetical protein